mmetsp:Transcript_111027/g.220864  ORF Transcript_111027/g.220864 Transcript_111027/m.220864 type:complete len:281 (+) Transcript_111027:69-911(+)
MPPRPGRHKKVSTILKRPAVAHANSKRAPAKKLRVTEREVTEQLAEVNWVPLESNPDMFTYFARHIGLPEGWAFVDVLGVDPELISETMVSRPCLGVTLLFEYSENLIRSQTLQEQKLRARGNDEMSSQGVFFMKQYVGNACGTIAAIHCVANAAKALHITADSPVGQLLERTKGHSAKVIGAALADMEDFHMASEECAVGGQTEAPEADEDTNHHFICFVEHRGHVFELDGAKSCAIDHGLAGADFLAATVKVIKANFMDADPENIQFNMMALVQCSEA